MAVSQCLNTDSRNIRAHTASECRHSLKNSLLTYVIVKFHAYSHRTKRSFVVSVLNNSKSIVCRKLSTNFPTSKKLIIVDGVVLL